MLVLAQERLRTAAVLVKSEHRHGANMPAAEPQNERAGEAQTAVGLALRDAGIRAVDFPTAHERRAEAVIAWIRARPVTSLLIGAGVGYLLGRRGGR
jgi:hypothetical protein